MTIEINETNTIAADTFFALQDALDAGKSRIEMIKIVRESERALGRDASIKKALAFVRSATGRD